MINAAQLQRALHSGVVPHAALHLHLKDAALRGVVRGLSDVERKVGRRVMKANIATPTQIDTLAAQVATRRNATLVKGLNTQKKKTVASAIDSVIRNDMDTRDARDVIAATAGLNGRQAAALVNYTASLRADGYTGRELETRIGAYQSRLISQRASTILNHEARYAENAGQEEGWSLALEQGWLEADQRRIWIADNAACEDCQDMDGETALIGEPFDGGYNTPQDIHVNCGCTEGLE